MMTHKSETLVPFRRSQQLSVSVVQSACREHMEHAPMSNFPPAGIGYVSPSCRIGE